jgi:hypothetical protein
LIEQGFRSGEQLIAIGRGLLSADHRSGFIQRGPERLNRQRATVRIDQHRRVTQ